jgi:hypothetical protein
MPQQSLLGVFFAVFSIAAWALPADNLNLEELKKSPTPSFCQRELEAAHLFRVLSHDDLKAFESEIFSGPDTLRYLAGGRQWYIFNGLRDHSAAFSDPERFTFAFTPKSLEGTKALVSAKKQYFRERLAYLLPKAEPALPSALQYDVEDTASLARIYKYMNESSDPKRYLRERFQLNEYFRLAYAELLQEQMLKLVESAKNYRAQALPAHASPKEREAQEAAQAAIPHRGRSLVLQKAKKGDEKTAAVPEMRVYFGDFVSLQTAAARRWEELTGLKPSVDFTREIHEGHYDRSFFARILGGIFPVAFKPDPQLPRLP